MAKKSRRRRHERVAKQPVRVQATQPVETSSSNNPAQDALDFTEDYFYVYRDVRTLLIVTVIMIVLTVGLSYFV